MQKLNSFKDVQDFIDMVLTTNNELGGVSVAPHGNFWRKLPYVEFTTGNVPGVFPATKIMVKGDAKNSVLIGVLRGTNTDFDQMPANGPPFFTDDQIASIADWIDAGCPEHPPAGNV